MMYVTDNEFTSKEIDIIIKELNGRTQVVMICFFWFRIHLK